MARRTRSRKNNPVAKHAVHPIEAEIAQVKDDLQAQLAIATPLSEVEAVKKIVEPVVVKLPEGTNLTKAPKKVSVEPIQEITEKSLKADIIDEACVLQAEDAKTIDDIKQERDFALVLAAVVFIFGILFYDGTLHILLLPTPRRSTCLLEYC